ncbi:MAG: hypothetical protein QXM68_00940 [Candidatus Aenigmatarchaeota archaeon]|nr:NAD(+)/NADH kinase [Candidatus Aenigmarchaeota archaeon]
MKVAIVESGRNLEMKKIISKYFKIVKNDPDFVISIGGDGTILASERLYPSIPKLTIKTSQICRKCDYSPNRLEIILKMLNDGKYELKKEMKLEAKFKGKRIIALNEIQLHNENPTVAIRFDVYADKMYRNVIGDGVIVSTPFGSTGYFKSITGKSFKKGIGIAFNNSYNFPRKPIIIDEKSKIKIKLNRESGLLLRDNDQNFVRVKENQKIYIKKARKPAFFVNF